MKKFILAVLSVVLLLQCALIVMPKDKRDVILSKLTFNSSRSNELELKDLEDGRYIISSNRPKEISIEEKNGKSFIRPFTVSKEGFLTYLNSSLVIKGEGVSNLKLKRIEKVSGFENGKSILPGVYFTNRNEITTNAYRVKNTTSQPIEIFQGTTEENTKDTIYPGDTGLVNINKKRIQISSEDAVKFSEAYPKNSKERLFLPTAYGNIDLIHPSVILLDEPFNGYKFWMAATPYLKSDMSSENPHIYASNDGVTWDVPTGLVNPIDPKPGQPKDRSIYNSDTHLIYNYEKNRLECFYREYNNKEKIKATIKLRTSTDGVHWSEESDIIKLPVGLSQAVVLEDGVYKMWYIDGNFDVCYIESVDGMKTWSEERIIPIEYKEKNVYSWHLDVQKNKDGSYGMLISSFKFENNKKVDLYNTGGARQEMGLYYGSSKDNQNYSEFIKVLGPTTGTNNWDNRGLYRSCYVSKNDQVIVYYSGIRTDGGRGLGITVGKDMTHLKGVSFSDIVDLSY
ncbi:hypothetical protein [Vagococcus fessus]|uniref:Sialidase domain-containing protein n=1 Tax=Vagococcus fessus TaxID=120370 RepID=A0A430A6H3_9ENTE|nr:hypothetical protein [Vagococcus fessus]RSU02476.1 hypothetical protein CBF31_08905 [Vagococcus fessus]